MALKRSRPRFRLGAKALVPVILAVLTASAVLLAPGSTETAVANGDTRTIRLYHAHTHESIEATFLVDGRYDSGVLEKLNWFLRDWRRDEPTHMDPRLFDTIWEVYRESGSGQPIEVMSAYRSPETNAMLRRRSRAVAEHSQHILGKAMDQHYVDVPMSRIREIAMKLQRGGVGFYPTSGTPFVHMDVGGVRHWPRMSYDQLARLFPDGKTVHIPSNGQPLAGYEQARAELEARGDSFSYPTAGEVKSKGFFAWLFGGGDEEGDAESARGDTRRGGQRVAALDRGASGAVPTPLTDISGSKDAGARAFNLSSGVAGRGAPPYASPVAAARPAPAPTPPVVAAEPAPTLPTPSERQMLARAMVANGQGANPAIPEQPVSRAAPPVVPSPALPPEPARPLAETTPTVAPVAPLPPRRPVELAAAGPGAPLPPSRPTEFASLTPPHGPDSRSGKLDIAGRPPGGPTGRAADLPAVITQGQAIGRPPASPALAYSAEAAVPPPPARPYVPLPVARPQFVAARLDRSNFRSLTGSTAAVRATARSAIGSSMTALRPAAQSAQSVMIAQSSGGFVQGFGSKATDLSSDRFAGSAVKPRERVITSAVAAPGKLRSGAD